MRFLKILGRVLVAVLAVIGGLGILSFVSVVVAALSHRPAPLPAQMVLLLDLNSGLIESRPTRPLAMLQSADAYVLSDVIGALERAAQDPRVSGLVVKLDGPGPGIAEAQEIRDAVAAFRESGKRALIYSAGFGDFGGGSAAYYLASAFKEVWLQPSGGVGLTGFHLESPFIKGTLDLLGVQPQFGARWEYKTAIDIFTEKQFTKEGRDSLTLLLQAWTNQLVAGIAATRGLKPEDVAALIDKGPLLAKEALDAHLVDRLGYWDEARASLVKDGAEIVDLNRYNASLPPEPAAVPVALITGVGPVQESGGDNPLAADGEVMASDRIAQAFRDASANPDIKAILFRISSPGGSYGASDEIRHAVEAARAVGKPVVVSMGDVAASGGYFAALAADKIVAEPGTITGSIGVFAGKFVLGQLWKKLGITWDSVEMGKNSGMWSQNEPFTQDGWNRLNAMLDQVYVDFTQRTEVARGIASDQIERIARGRIWPGDQAKTVNLVDDIGGYRAAFVQIRLLARLPKQMPLNLVRYPRPTPAEVFLTDLTRLGHQAKILSVASDMRAFPAIRALEPLAPLVGGGDNFLLMPPIHVN
jgi:protease-4